MCTTERGRHHGDGVVVTHGKGCASNMRAAKVELVVRDRSAQAWLQLMSRVAHDRRPGRSCTAGEGKGRKSSAEEMGEIYSIRIWI